jgi:peptidoglycan/LPS O-acetylase OafA/YrhL
MERARHRLEYLDGLRGLSAVAVVAYHVWQFIITKHWSELPKWFSVATLLRLGTNGVDVFIVLSGYCLMLPLARSTKPELVGGVSGFAWRRARRILPPYYAAWLGSIAMIAFFEPLSSRRGTQWDLAISDQALGLPSLVLHGLMLHNVWEGSSLAINPPFWSVALEWQIYFIFALCLLPLWRTVGPAITVGIAWFAGSLPAYFGSPVDSTWYLGLFAFGMWAATLRDVAPMRFRNPVALCLAALGLAASFVNPKLPTSFNPTAGILGDAALGAGVAIFLVERTARTRTGAKLDLFGRLCGWKPLEKVGVFSYSLYLIHFPLLAAMFMLLQGRVHGLTQFFVLCALGIPGMIGAAYAFHCAFERPFMVSTSRARSPQLGLPS